MFENNIMAVIRRERGRKKIYVFIKLGSVCVCSSSSSSLEWSSDSLSLMVGLCRASLPRVRIPFVITTVTTLETSAVAHRSSLN